VRAASSCSKRDRRRTAFVGLGESNEALQQQAADQDQSDTVKSLQMGRDERYIKMDYYRKYGGSAAADGHFQRLSKTNRRMHGLVEDQAAITDGSQMVNIAEREKEEEPWRLDKKPAASVQDRVEWQEIFDRSINRLFIDFQLSDSPACRLNHLERMNTWFTEHGAKQTRKARPGPSYLVADRASPMPPGSSKNVPAKLSNTSLMLADIYTGGHSSRPSTRGSARGN